MLFRSLKSAKVNLKHLYFNLSLKLLDKGNVKRLVGIFKAGCLYANKGNYIPTKIEKYDLDAAVARSRKVALDLFRIGAFFRLLFPKNFNLAYLYR